MSSRRGGHTVGSPCRQSSRWVLRSPGGVVALRDNRPDVTRDTNNTDVVSRVRGMRRTPRASSEEATARLEVKG